MIKIFVEIVRATTGNDALADSIWRMAKATACIFFFTFALIIYFHGFFMLNRYEISSMLLMSTGGMLNFIAVLFNGWKMPVKVPRGYAIDGRCHKRLNNNTRLKFLTDIFVMGRQVISLGDFLVIFGGILTSGLLIAHGVMIAIS